MNKMKLQKYLVLGLLISGILMLITALIFSTGFSELYTEAPKGMDDLRDFFSGGTGAKKETDGQITPLNNMILALGIGMIIVALALKFLKIDKFRTGVVTTVLSIVSVGVLITTTAITIGENMRVKAEYLKFDVGNIVKRTTIDTDNEIYFKEIVWPYILTNIVATIFMLIAVSFIVIIIINFLKEMKMRGTVNEK